VIASVFSQPAGFDQWIVAAELAAGAEIVWEGPHGDEAMYVVSGQLQVGEATCVAEGAVIIESAAPATVRAVEDTRIVHMGSAVPDVPTDGPLGPPAREAHGVHVHGPSGDPTLSSGDSSAAFFARGRCPTCRIMFYRVRSTGDTRSHSHSEAQLQHVLAGTIGVATFDVGAGMTVALPPDYRYRYRASGPWEILVYRRDMSLMRRGPGDDAMLEG
jgi:quercetin dioxygenase-like cupin family protein